MSFDNFILAEQLFAKAFQSFATCVLVNNNLCGKITSSLESPTILDERFTVTSSKSKTVFWFFNNEKQC